MTKQHTTHTTTTRSTATVDREPTMAELQAIENEGDIVEELDIDELLKQLDDEEENY